MRRTMTAMTALLLIGAASVPHDYVVPADGVVAARLNGVPLRLRIDPGSTAMPLVTDDIAARAQVKSGMFGTLYGVGPVHIAGRTGVATLDLAGTILKRRVSFAPRAYAEGFDGVMGPGGLEAPVVRFALRAPIAGERSVALPMVDQGGLMAGWAERFALIEVGGQPLRIRFDPHHPRTLATAGAAVRLAAAYDGTMSGIAGRQEIAFGVERPIRTLTLARALGIGPLSLQTLGVRTADNGHASGIAEAGAKVDPNEIVVTAKGKHDPNRDRLSLGADTLARCSSIVFDKPARVIRLTCA